MLEGAKIFLTGGYKFDERQDSAQAARYDYSTDEWIELPKMREAR